MVVEGRCRDVFASYFRIIALIVGALVALALLRFLLVYLFAE